MAMASRAELVSLAYILMSIKAHAQSGMGWRRAIARYVWIPDDGADDASLEFETRMGGIVGGLMTTVESFEDYITIAGEVYNDPILTKAFKLEEHDPNKP